MWIICKVFIEFVTILLLFYVLGFWPQACGILASWPGIEPVPPTLEGKVLTTGPPGEVPIHSFYLEIIFNWQKSYKNFKKAPRGTFLVVQWQRLQAPSAGGHGSIPGWGTRSHRPQLENPTGCNEDWRSLVLQLSPGAAKKINMKMTVLIAQLCLTLCDPVDCGPPGSSVHGVLQARILGCHGQ